MAGFELSAVNHAPAFFDLKKLEWMNKEYLRAMSVDDFIEAAGPWLAPGRAPWPPERFDEAVFRCHGTAMSRSASGCSARCPTWSTSCSWRSPCSTRGRGSRWSNDDTAPAVLDAAIAVYGDCPWTAESLHSATQALADGMGRKLNKVQAPIRVAVTGRRVGPPLFQSLEVLGREAVLQRLRAARERLGGDPG